MNNYHHGNLKEELIECACRLCDRDGYTKLSIRSLAKESGVSQTAPYRHFETKGDKGDFSRNISLELKKILDKLKTPT